MNITLLNPYIKLPVLLLLTILTAGNAFAQDSKKEERVKKAEDIKQMVSLRQFVFKAQFALPMGGSSISLTSDYEVKVLKDTVVAFLPYFGRAYSAPAYPSEGGIRFTSSDFQYNVSNKKKRGWDVVIRPKDAKSVQQLTFYISESGYGSLQVTDNNRQPITFNGYYQKGKQ